MIQHIKKILLGVLTSLVIQNNVDAGGLDANGWNAKYDDGWNEHYDAALSQAVAAALCAGADPRETVRTFEVTEGKTIITVKMSEKLARKKVVGIKALRVDPQALPDYIGDFSKLECLSIAPPYNLEYFLRLQTLETLRDNSGLGLDNYDLTTLPSSITKLTHLTSFDVQNCPNLSTLPSFSGFTNLKSLLLLNTGISRLPESLSCCNSLESLEVSTPCENILQIAATMPTLKTFLFCTQGDELPKDFSLPRSVQSLCIRGESLKRLPECVFSSLCLTKLTISDARNFCLTPEIQQATNLTHFKCSFYTEGLEHLLPMKNLMFLGLTVPKNKYALSVFCKGADTIEAFLKTRTLCEGRIKSKLPARLKELLKTHAVIDALEECANFRKATLDNLRFGGEVTSAE